MHFCSLWGTKQQFQPFHSNVFDSQLGGQYPEKQETTKTNHNAVRPLRRDSQKRRRTLSTGLSKFCYCT